MIQQIHLRNLLVLDWLDHLVPAMTQHPAVYKETPKPNVTLSRMKEQFANRTDYKVDRGNFVDYVGRKLHKNGKPYRQADVYTPKQLAGLFNARIGAEDKIKEVVHKKFKLHTCMVQPPYWGWTGWEWGARSPRHFIRFIWNSGEGHTRFVHGGKYIKYADSKGIGQQKNWTCLIGTHDELNWMCDRNTGKTHRFIIDISINSKYHQEFETVCDFIKDKGTVTKLVVKNG